jgi:hypothetical protein
MSWTYIGVAFVCVSYAYLGFNLGKKGRNVFLAPSLAVMFFIAAPVWVVLWMQNKLGFKAGPPIWILTTARFLAGRFCGKRSRSV